MENERMLEIAIQSLSSFDPETIETVQLERTKYDDGSVGYSVNVTFPAPVIKKSFGISKHVDIDKIADVFAKKLEEGLSGSL